MGTIDWNHPRSWDEACRRHAARQRGNAVRRVVAEDRRRRVLELVLALGGLERGAQSRIAAALGVHRSTICKDLRRLLPLAAPCPACGTLRPRERWDVDCRAFNPFTRHVGPRACLQALCIQVLARSH